MVAPAHTEFWRDLKPIANALMPDAKPEAYIADAAADDPRLYVPFTETVSSRPLWISPTHNQWCDILCSRSAGLVNRHYHPHEVFAYTISGKWGYLEHDWTATAGDFVYESPGEGHTLVAFEHEQPMKVFFIVKGPLIWLDDEGNATGYFDVHSYIAMCRAHYERVGLGAAAIDKLFR
ncbi:2,4-dihydroxyacetophenone dioxygenase [Burkholderia singularis]|uniref:2,4-dihydroxyacetophenone dioxygenase n=1 Tax=Burkholderia singularis TaxID=1503053 RepID=A0A103E1D2_9BURK|nr:2,4'-dihydroxyacetophenone dioxygenase family protein [Burkholderia singularis]KVE26550.1 2,4-dihydroxyacetophenone dioxygenase [Burkholderia singularis]